MSTAENPDSVEKTSVEKTTSFPELPERVGLLAGGGRFPIIVAQDLRRQGIEVVCAALRDQADPELETVCSVFRFFGLGRLNAALRFFKSHGVQEITWAGWIRKTDLFRPWRLLSVFPDWRMIRFFFFHVKDRQNQTLLAGLAEEFESDGFHLAHSAKYSPHLLASEGVLSRRRHRDLPTDTPRPNDLTTDTVPGIP